MTLNTINKPVILNKKYRILEKIGAGKFGIIYKGINLKTNHTVAIKTEDKTSSIKLLKNETSIMKYLYDHDCRSTPTVYWYGVDLHNSYLVMPHYDISLFDYCNQKQISEKKINKIMAVCIDILETIHKNYILHRDIKPQNFMISNDEIFLIDFGFSCFYVDDKINHLPESETAHIIGTPKYVSFHVHNGTSNTRRDDLISLGYLYMYLNCRELPWDNLKLTMSKDNEHEYDESDILHDKNQQRKTAKSWDQLQYICNNIDKNIYNFLDYCYKLEYNEAPLYDGMRQLFMT
jgi:casein kinase 1